MSSDTGRPSATPTSASPPAYEPRHLANVVAALRQDPHPSQIGPYEIVGILGEGGMGTVYRGEQHHPIQRTVAIKVIRFGMDTRAVLARFESERRALAMMDHPNVARVLDAGTTDGARPYFVMEFVDGTPITTFSDEHRLSVRDRLALMMQACAAVQHAHQKAIIHRDLKPSNILVSERDGERIVKVIDFGVAKAVAASSAERTLFTEVGQLVGTPEYMSPEQADGDRDIDTRSDVYSLGAVLYELLSGALPFEPRTLRQAGYSEICRIIREVDPPRPSARLVRLGNDATKVAELRQTSAAALTDRLRSELDWIVVKTLRKDRERRYASPDELMQDISNYLSNRPLRAGPESLVYRTRKFVSRNRGLVGGVGLGAALLALGVAATAWQAVRATRAEHAAREAQARMLTEKTRAEAANAATAKVNEFLVGMLQAADPGNAQGKPVLVRDVLDRAAATVGRELSGQPQVEAAVRSALGDTYIGLGLLAQADEHLLAAWHLTQKAEGADSRAALTAEQHVASLRILQDRLDEALAMTQSVLDRCRRQFGEEDGLTLDVKCELAAIADHRGDAAQAEKIYREALLAYERSGSTNTRTYYTTAGNLGQLLRLQSRLDEAGPLCLRAYEGTARLNGPDDPVAIDMRSMYADVLRLQGRADEAEPLMRDCLERALRVLGADHPATITLEQGLAVILQVEGKKDEALIHFRDALARTRKVLGNEHRDTLAQVMGFAASRLNEGDIAEGEALFREAFEGWRRSVGLEHPDTMASLYGLFRACLAGKKENDALENGKLLYETLRVPGRVQISEDRRSRYLSAYGVALTQFGHDLEAIEPLITAYKACIEEDRHTALSLNAYRVIVTRLAEIAERQGDPEKASWWRGEAGRFEAPDPSATTQPSR